MQYKLLHEAGERTFALIFGIHDEVMPLLRSFAHEHDLNAAHFTAIGAFSQVTVAYFDWQTREYRHIPIDEQVEVLMLAGDITEKEDRPSVHAHVVVGKRDSTAHGGHLISARVRPTLEMILTETPAHLKKKFDNATGLALIDVSADRSVEC